MNQINVKEGATFGYGILMEHWRSIAPLIIIMLPAFFVVSMLGQYLTNPMVSNVANNVWVRFPSTLLISLLQFWLIAPFHVSIYRLVLCKEPVDMSYYQRLFCPREINYFWKQVIFTLILMSIMIAFGFAISIPILLATFMESIIMGVFAGFAASVCFIALIVVISLRLSLVFPAISVDQDLEFLSSYQKLKGHTWKFFLCVTLAVLPYIALSLLMLPLMFFMLNSLIGLSVITLIQTGLGFLLSVPIIVVIAYAFQKISVTE
ncbi:MAG: hypothetical protein ABFQ95_01760 [Pseudomonadota bacterium]